MTCLPSSTLVACAFGSGDVAQSDRRHLSSCPSCTAEVGRLRAAAALLPRAAAPEIVTDECLDEAALAQLAADGRAASQPDVVAHLAECTRCRTRLAGAVRALNSSAVAQEIERLETGGSARPQRARGTLVRYAAIAAGIAAVALLPQLVGRAGEDAPRPPLELRDDDATITAAGGPVLVAPRGDVAPTRLLVWTRVPGADAYAVTVFSATGQVVWEQSVADTALHLPAELKLPAGDRLLWQVRARTGFDRWVESELVAFQVRGDD